MHLQNSDAIFFDEKQKLNLSGMYGNDYPEDTPRHNPLINLTAVV